MTLNEFFTAAERYMNLGQAVQKQLQKVTNTRDPGYMIEDINSNALAMIKDFLGYLAESFEEDELGADAFGFLVSIDEMEEELKDLNAPPEFEP